MNTLRSIPRESSLKKSSCSSGPLSSEFDPPKLSRKRQLKRLSIAAELRTCYLIQAGVKYIRRKPLNDENANGKGMMRSGDFEII